MTKKKQPTREDVKNFLASLPKKQAREIAVAGFELLAPGKGKHILKQLKRDAQRLKERNSGSGRE